MYNISIECTYINLEKELHVGHHLFTIYIEYNDMFPLYYFCFFIFLDVMLKLVRPIPCGRPTSLLTLTLYLGVIQNIPKSRGDPEYPPNLLVCSLCHFYVSRKFYKNQFMFLFIMLLVDRQTNKQINQKGSKYSRCHLGR